MKKVIVVLSVALSLLAGCGQGEMSLASACDELGGFCETKLTADANCKNERRDVIINAAKLKTLEDKKTLPNIQYDQLIALEKLVECTHKESLIEYVSAESKFGLPPKEGGLIAEYQEKIAQHNKDVALKSEAKERNYIIANEYLKTLAALTKGDADPHLLYWHWSREDDQVALSKLIKSHESGRELGYEINYYLALDYATYDRKKAIDLLLSSLEYYPPELFTSKAPRAYKQGDNLYDDDAGAIHYDILRSLSSLYLKEGKTQLSYIMASILWSKNDISVSLDDIRLKMPSQLASDDNIEKLERLSAKIENGIEQGHFVRQSYGFLL